MKQFFDIDGVDCKHFSGYKPCFPGEDCSETCQRREPVGTRILIVNLDAMGDVLMTTAQLTGIKRSYPESQVSWITRKNAAALLLGNPLIDKVFDWNDENRLVLSAQRFDIVLNADKSVEACAFVRMLDCGEVRGFTLSRRGQIIPANPEAEYNFRMGLDDHLKFRLNTRTGQDILAESWKLDYRLDEYVLGLSAEELSWCEEKRREWQLDSVTVIGVNTGCSLLFPNKKMTVDQHVQLLSRLLGQDGIAVLLLGGPEDTERNREIHSRLHEMHPGGRLISTPTTDGLRRGICYENLADAVITGDSFGMHLAIGLGKHVFAWFGLSCWEEIELYGRGRKFFPAGLECSPCWKRVCPYNLECISMIDLDGIYNAVLAFAYANQASKTEAEA